MKNRDDLNVISSHLMQKKNKKLKLILITTACVLVFAVIAAAVWGVFYIKSILNFNYNEISEKPEDLGFTEVKDDDIVNIALFGIDTDDKDTFKGRSDSIIVLSVNKTDKKIKLISIMRDSFVPIEENGKVRYHIINNAYSTGGPELAIKTINKVYDLDISEYVTVNFYGLINIIDAVGGLEVTVVNGELEQLNGAIRNYCWKVGIDPEQYVVNEGGSYLFNGIQAMSYARVRKANNFEGTGGDYGRTDRQRYILQKLFDKAVKMEISQFINLIKTLTPYCQTSLTSSEMLSLAIDVLLKSPTLEESRVPFTEYLMKDPENDVGDVVYYDLDFAAKLIHSFIYEDITPEKYIEQNGIEQKDWYADIKAGN